MQNEKLQKIIEALEKLPQESLAELGNMSPEMITKRLIRQPNLTRFERLAYNRYKQQRLREELETFKELLKENNIEIPEYQKTPQDYFDAVLKSELEKAKRGNEKSKTTLMQALKKGLIEKEAIAEIL